MYLEIRNNVTAAQALMRRLRHQRPEAPVVLGIWAGERKDESFLNTGSLQDVHPVISLQEGLARCGDLALAARQRPIEVAEMSQAL